MIDAAQFRQYVLGPALDRLAPFGPARTKVADDLVMGIFAQETHLGQWLRQQGGGPGLGLGSIEPLTLANAVRTMPAGLLSMISIPGVAPVDQVVFDLRYAVITARWYCWIQPDRLPASSEPEDLWLGYRDMWCKGCAATEAEFIANYAAYAAEQGREPA